MGLGVRRTKRRSFRTSALGGGATAAWGTILPTCRCDGCGRLLSIHQPCAQQIKTIWSVLLRNFEWELVDPIPEPNWNAMVIGPLDGKVKYTPRTLTL